MAGESTTGAATAAGTEPATGAEGTGASTAKQPATGAAAPATGTPDPTVTPPTYTPEQIADILASNERMQSALKDANKESEKHRKAAKEAADAKLSDEERAKQERTEFEQAQEAFLVERAELRVSQQVLGLAGSLGIVDTDIVIRLIDWDELEFDEAGVPQNVESVVKSILAKKPFLAGKATPTSGTQTGNNAAAGTGGSQPAPNLTAAELEAATKAGLTPERFAALKSVQTLDQWKATRRTGQGT